MSAVPVRVAPTAHCVERWLERVRPGLGPSSARADLEAVLPLGRLVEHPPSWLADRRRQPVAYLLVGDDLALPLAPTADGRFAALTVLARGSISPAQRARRKARKQRRGVR